MTSYEQVDRLRQRGIILGLELALTLRGGRGLAVH